jgi:hypothetical protein
MGLYGWWLFNSSFFVWLDVLGNNLKKAKPPKVVLVPRLLTKKLVSLSRESAVLANEPR